MHFYKDLCYSSYTVNTFKIDFMNVADGSATFERNPLTLYVPQKLPLFIRFILFKRLLYYIILYFKNEWPRPQTNRITDDVAHIQQKWLHV